MDAPHPRVGAQPPQSIPREPSEAHVAQQAPPIPSMGAAHNLQRGSWGARLSAFWELDQTGVFARENRAKLLVGRLVRHHRGLYARTPGSWLD